MHYFETSPKQKLFDTPLLSTVIFMRLPSFQYFVVELLPWLLVLLCLFFLFVVGNSRRGHVKNSMELLSVGCHEMHRFLSSLLFSSCGALLLSSSSSASAGLLYCGENV